MSARRMSLPLAFVIGALVALTSATPPVQAQAQTFYAVCTECHTLSLDEARGMLESHGQTFIPEFPEGVCGNCHDISLPHDGPSWPPGMWLSPLDPYAYYSGGPSLTVQACDTCHDRSQPPLSLGHHPHDTIPYALAAAYPPPQSSILPLFTPEGFRDQNPGMGGMTCATCHDAHEPGQWDPGTGKFTYGRISNGPTSALCTWCHDDKGPPPYAYDLFIERRSDSVTFTQPPGAPFVNVEVTITNRGNAPYYGGMLDVMIEEGYQPPLFLGSFPIPSIPPDGSAVVPFPWDASELTRSAVLHLLPDSGQPQPLNPDRSPVFIRTYAVVPTPQDLTVGFTTPESVGLIWTPPPGYPGYLEYHVFRDGVQVTPFPMAGNSYVDGPLSPETPHTYAVQAVTSDERTSAMSNRVGATTTTGYVIRVPQDFSTIQQAINAAWPGTSIHVAPGTYEEPFSFYGKTGISVVGQDALGCTLDFGTFGPGFVDLDPNPGSPNSLSGFTIVGGTVMMGQGDTVANCVFRDSPYESVAGSGLVTNCVFDEHFGNPDPFVPVAVHYNEFMTVANSVFLGPNPFWVDPSAGIYLLNNAFDSINSFNFDSLPGEGNFHDFPYFSDPGPPNTYVIVAGPCIDGGFDVGLPFLGRPDVGAFELGFPTTPAPPSGLTAAWDGTLGGIRLDWSLSPDDPYSPAPSVPSVQQYLVYRSEYPEVGMIDPPLAVLPSGAAQFVDPTVPYGVTYFYQVRASAGAPWPSEPVIVSRASNTASASMNLAPVASDDNYVTDMNEPLLINAPGVLGNDTDPESNPLIAVIVSLPTYGDLVLGADGTVYYTPAFYFTGTDTFTYVANDGFSDSNVAVVTITVNALNAPPLLQPIGPRSVAEGDRVLIDLAASDPDPGDLLAFSVAGLPPFCTMTDLGRGGGAIDCLPGFFEAGSYTLSVTVSDNGLSPLIDQETFDLTVTNTNQPPSAAADTYSIAEDSVLVVPAPGVLANDSDVDGDAIYLLTTMPTLHGSFDFDQDGSFTYTPNPDFSGLDSFTYRATDGTNSSDEIRVWITVNALGDAPALASIGNRTVAEQAVLHIPLSATDPDPMDPLTFTAAGLPGCCTLTGNPNRTGTIDCTPGYDDAGAYAVTVTVSDSNSPVLTDAETFTLTITNTNRAPQALDDAYAVDEDALLTIPAPGVLGNDADPDGDVLSAVIVTGVSHGALALNADGSYTYSPTADFHGSDSFTYTAGDGLLDSNIATVSITVAPVNDAPLVTDPVNQNGTERDAVSLQIVASDAEGDPLTYSATGLPAGLAINPGTGLISGTLGSSSSGDHTVTVTVSDSAAASSAVFIWTVADVPLLRVASIAMGEYSAKGKTSYTALALLLNDGGLPVGGAAVTGHWTGSGADSAPLAVTTSADGTAAFESNEIRRPEGVYLFTIDNVVKNGSVYDAAGSVTSAQYPPPGGGNPPVANADSAATTTDTPVTIAVLANDTDPDGDPLTVTNLSSPAHGTASANGDGTVTYTPATGFTGTDSFTYTAFDGTFTSGPALVTVAVADPPVGGLMHVAAIDMSVGGKKVVKAAAAVTVVDAAGAPVAGVTVSGAWTGAAPGAISGVTGTDGTVILSSPGVKAAAGQSFTFTVTGLESAGWTYDAAANAETADSITAP